MLTLSGARQSLNLVPRLDEFARAGAKSLGKRLPVPLRKRCRATPQKSPVVVNTLINDVILMTLPGIPNV